MPRQRKTAKFCALVAWLGFFAIPGTGAAHHNVGHGQSESMRSLSTIGSEPLPRQRAGLIASAVRSTSEPTLNTATTYSLSALVSLRLVERVYLLGDFPAVLIDEDETSEMKWGYGDTRVGAQWVVGELREDRSPRFTLGMGLSIPTRTFTFEVDPGRQWLVTPSLLYTDSYRSVFWFAALQLANEFRPAGYALDVSPSAAVGLQLAKPWSFTLGLTGDIRALSTCNTPTGTELCNEGRATESNRPWGATRLYALLATSVTLSKRWSIFANGQLPVTSRKDIEWAANLGAEAVF